MHESSEDALDQKKVLEFRPDLHGGLLEPLEALDESESVAACELLLAAVTAREREIVSLLLNEMQDGAPLTQAKKAVAELLDVGTNRIDVAFTKIRKRIPDPR